MDAFDPTMREAYRSKYWGDDSFSDSSSPDVVAWRLTRSVIEHENLLVNHRMTWFLTCQAFLFSAFVLLFLAGSKGELHDFEPLLPEMLLTIGLFAGYICLVTQDALGRAMSALNKATIHFDRIKEANGMDPIVPPLHHWRPAGLVNQHWVPASALVLWIVLLVSCIVYAVPNLRSLLKLITLTDIWYVLGALFLFGLGYAVRGSRARAG